MNDMGHASRRYHLMVPIGVMRGIFAPQTAFVGMDLEDGRYLVHLEEPGDASNVVTHEDRIRHAAGRLHDSYPTSKMTGGDAETFRKVGTVLYRDGIGWHIETLFDREALEAWADGPHCEGGSPALHEEALVRRINHDMTKGKFA